ncbi:hypothetical protein MRB53_010582 [Persea americana]|uniref:Uncharacterized protein n=1 Tax=Persea americana TaxID=3435 RepID=A0ACC2LS81_PERAE|nr:hypothetical protein MRB53_010582 [Persea americana]
MQLVFLNAEKVKEDDNFRVDIDNKSSNLVSRREKGFDIGGYGDNLAEEMTANGNLTRINSGGYGRCSLREEESTMAGDDEAGSQQRRPGRDGIAGGMQLSQVGDDDKGAIVFREGNDVDECMDGISPAGTLVSISDCDARIESRRDVEAL